MTRRAKIADLLPEPLELELPDGTVATVQILGVDDMMRMFQAEMSLTDEGATMLDQGKAFIASRDLVVEIIRRDNPGAFMEDKDGVLTLVTPDWPAESVMKVLSLLAGHETVADAVRDTLSGDEAERAASEAEALQRGETGAGAAEDDEAGPTDSQKPLPTPSSPSDRTSDGSLNGGADVVGPPSPVTSSTPDTQPASV